MPGAPFMAQQEVQQTVGVPQGANGALQAGGGDHLNFIVWLIVLGLVVPVIILGSLRVGGFQFVFKSR
jgi:hypothetical protein